MALLFNWYLLFNIEFHWQDADKEDMLCTLWIELLQEEEDEELSQEGQQNEEGEGGGLSKSGRELKKLLGKQDLDESDGAEDDEEGDEDVRLMLF